MNNLVHRLTAIAFASILTAAGALAQTQAADIPPEHAAHMSHDMPMPALSGNSVYQVNISLADQDSKLFKLSERKGKPMLISMFYSSCKFVCPMLIDTMQLTEAALNEKERAALNVTLVSFDPTHDDVKALKTVSTNRNLDLNRWSVDRTEDASARKLAAALGIQYRLLPDGEFNHTTIILLLDSEGRIVARTRKMGSIDDEFLAQVRQTLAHASHH